MKKYLDNKKGMALPMVLIIMLIVGALATGLAVYAYNAYLSVRWMSDEKKAYYLSRAGVEATAFAYQNALTKTSSSYSDLANYASFSEIDKLVTVAEGSTGKITTNKVYLKYSASDENDGTRWNGLEFKVYSTDAEAQADEGIIGYFTVEIGTGTDKISVTDEQTGLATEQDVRVKVFKSVSVVNGKTQSAFGYIVPPEGSSSLKLYDANGYLMTDSKDFVKTTKTIKYDTNIVDSNDGFFARLLKGLVLLIFDFLSETERTVDMYLKTSEGNVILEKPANARYIKANENKDNYYIFATTDNLFLQDCGIYSVTSKGYYSSLGFFGDQIVIDGDIMMEVYITHPDALASRLSSMVAMLGNRFRLGTVVLGDASMLGPDRYDCLAPNQGGVQVGGNKVPVNKVYFNGNVYLRVVTQGAGTDTFRIFNAGDMAYFYGAYEMPATTGGETVQARGIDLVKYFVDAVIAKKDGHVYGTSIINKMKQINELYYGGTSDDETSGISYFIGSDVLMRKIEVDYNANGIVTVDRGYGSVLDIIQPSGVDSSSLIWGRPRGGDDL